MCLKNLAAKYNVWSFYNDANNESLGVERRTASDKIPETHPTGLIRTSILCQFGLSMENNLKDTTISFEKNDKLNNELPA